MKNDWGLTRPRQMVCDGCRFVCCLICSVFLLSFPSAKATDAIEPTLQIPKPGENFLHILTPTMLELVRINTKQPDPGALDSWDWVQDETNFVPPSMASVKVLVNGQVDAVVAVGFKRRPIYAPQ